MIEIVRLSYKECHVYLFSQCGILKEREDESDYNSRINVAAKLYSLAKTAWIFLVHGSNYYLQILLLYLIISLFFFFLKI